MIISWWLVWMVFMLAFAVSPVSYGWGYRRWGPPYPRYIQQRRAAAYTGSVPFDHHAWGWGGDFVWMVTFIGIFWFIAAFWLW
jgi:hypothetical protein